MTTHVTRQGGEETETCLSSSLSFEENRELSQESSSRSVCQLDHGGAPLSAASTRRANFTNYVNSCFDIVKIHTSNKNCFSITLSEKLPQPQRTCTSKFPKGTQPVVSFPCTPTKDGTRSGYPRRLHRQHQPGYRRGNQSSAMHDF